MPGRRPLTPVLLLVGVVVIAAAVVVLSGHNHPSGDADAAAAPRLPRVAGVARACLLDPIDARLRMVDTATWDELQKVARRRPMLAQRTPVQPAHPSTAARVTLLDSAVARRCDAVVVIGTGWDRALAGAAARHRADRFVLITTAASATPPPAHVSALRYTSGQGFVPSLNGVIPR